VRHQAIRDERVDRIGNWLLDTKEFREWYNGSENGGSDHAALFCYGDPGVGKSYIRYEGPPVRNKQRILSLTGSDGSSMVVDYLGDQAMGQGMAVACFYSSQARIIRKQGLKIYMVKPLRLSERPYKLKTRIFEYFFPGTSTMTSLPERHSFRQICLAPW